MATNESVVLTAELRDELSAPLKKVDEKIGATATGIEKSSKRQAKATEQASDKMQTAMDKAAKKAGRMESIFKKIGGTNTFSGLTKGIETARDKIRKTTDKISDETKDRLKTGFAAAGVAAGAALVAGAAKSMAKEAGSDKLAAQLGLSGKASARAGRVSGRLYANAYGDSLETVNNAVGAVMSSVKGMRTASGKDVESLTKKVLDFSTAFEVDVGRASQVAGQMITSGLAKNGTRAVDLLTKAMQKVPAAVREDLLDAADEYGPFFSNLGISGEKAMGMLAASSEKGMYGIDKTGDAVKEFGIRATDMSKTTGEAYAALDLNTKDMTRQLLKGGETGSRAFQKIITKLQGMQDPVKRSQAAIKLFGTPLEDLSVNEIPKFLSSLSSTETGLGKVRGSAKRMGDTLNNNVSTSFETLKRKATGALTDLAAQAMPVLVPVLNTLIEFAPVIVPITLAVLGLAGAIKVAAVAMGIFNAVMKMNPVVRIISLVILAVTALVAGLMFAYKKVGWFRDAVDAAWAGIKKAVAAVVGWFRETALPFLSAVWDKIASGALWLWRNAIRPAFRGIKTAVFAVVDWFQTYVQPVISAAVRVVGAVFSWLWKKIVRPYFKFMWGAIKAFWMLASGVFKLVVAFVQKVLGPAFSWFYRKIVKPVFRFIGSLIAAWWDQKVRPILRAVNRFLKDIVGPAFQWLYRKVIKPVFDWIGDKIGGVWRKKIRPVFRTMMGFIKETVPAAFRLGVDAVGAAFAKVKAFAAAPIRFVIDTVINKGIIGAFNWVAKKLGVDTLPKVAMPAGLRKGGGNTGTPNATGGPTRFFDTGGYTGYGSKYQPAGIVHKDEYVIRKESQRKIEQTAPGMLDHMNRYGALPGHAKGGFVWPVPRRYPITQNPSAGHPAYDIGTPIGTSVTAAAPGRVALSGPGYRAPGVWGGNEVHVDHGGGVGSLYAHLSKQMVRVGQMVRQGQAIAASGNTGISSGPHLHFGALKGGRMVSPEPYLNGQAVGGEYGGVGGNGGGGFLANALNWVIDKIGNITDKIPGAGMFVDLAVGMGKKMISGVKDWVTDKVSSSGGGSGDPGGNIASWSKAALQHTGDFTPGNYTAMMRRMQQESGGNPRAVNNWDVNAQNGIPSRGLMQVIPPTFAAHRDKTLVNDIFDTLANPVAAINYTKARYGSLQAGWDRAGGYANGGLVKPSLFDSGGRWAPDTMGVNLSGKNEAVLDPEESANYKALMRNGGGGDTYVTISPTININGDVGDEDEIKARFVAMMEEAFREAKRKAH